MTVQTKKSLFVIPTIDAEGVHGDRPFDRMMLGVLDDGRRHGVTHLAGIFAQYGISATFFLDVYETSFFGEIPLRQVCDGLMQFGQDIQLHTHPAWRDDPFDHPHVREMKRSKSFLPQTKDFMFKCALDEQIRILEYGVSCLDRWCGFPPIAHRAGGYGLNEDTLIALRAVGIPVDSSMCYLQPNSKTTWSRNQVVARDGIVEVPITGFRRHRKVMLGPFRDERIIPFCKTDIDHCSLDELLWYTETAKEQGIRFMTLFLHSYSLLRYDKWYRRFDANPTNESKLKSFLSSIAADPSIGVMSLSEFWSTYEQSPLFIEGSDVVPDGYFQLPIIPTIGQKLREIVTDRLISTWFRR